MAQTFSPDNVLLSETLGKEITSEQITDLFTDALVQSSKVIQLGQKVEMDGKMVRKGVELGELTDAYFVGEGQKIGTAKVQTKSYVLEARKIAVILPVTEEVLNYTWTDYFESIKDKIVDLFNKKIDGAAFLVLYNNPFGNNVLNAAKTANNVVKDDEEAAKLAVTNMANILNIQKREEAKTNPPKTSGGNGDSSKRGKDKFASAKITNF